MDGVVAYILGKSYTKKSLIGIGALAGAPCQVQSINKVGKTTTITLKWEDNVGGVHTQSFDVEDGEDGVSVVGATINSTGNLILTLSDTNTIDCGKVLPQYDTMPTPSASNVGQILQYIGTTSGSYTKGYFYECVESPVGSGTYIWKYINVQDSYTKTEIGSLIDLPDNTKNVVQNISQLKLSIDQLQASKLSISDIDNALSLSSENPVQNKVITGALADKEDKFRVTTMPTVTSADVGKIVQYIGATDSTYTNGYFYQYKEISAGVYDWVQKNVQPNGGGTGGDGVVDGYYNSTDHLFYEEAGYINPISGESDTLYVSLDTNLLYRYNGLIFIRVDEATSGEDDVIDGYYNITNHKFYEEPTYITEITGQTGKIYISDDTNIQYRWDGTQFVTISSSIVVDNALSTTSENPVQNKVIALKIQDLEASKLSISNIDNALDNTSENPVQNKVIALALDQLQGSLVNKVDKETGKGLSSNDYTDTDKNKLINLAPIYLIGSGLNLDSTTGELTASGIDVPIDSALSTTSTNPVQNKVITIPLQALQGSVLTKMQKMLSAQQDNFAIFDNNGQVVDSNISKDIVPSGASSSNKLLVKSDIDNALSNTSENPVQNKVITVPLQALQGSMADKANKVSGATVNNFAGLDANGDLIDSGINKDIVPSGASSSNQLVTANDISTLSNKANKVASATNGDIATLDANGDLTDSGFSKDIIPNTATTSNKLVTNSDLPTELNDLSDDVVITSPVNNQILAYNSTSGKWENKTGQETIGGVVIQGSIMFADLPTTGMSNGDAYDIKDAFVTDSRFEEGAGISCGAGTDVVWIARENKWNILTPSGVYSFNGRTGAVSPATSDYDADQVDYDNTISGLTATDVQAAIDEVASEKADKVSSATSGHLAGLDGNGNLTDSGVVASNVIEKVTTATGLLKDDGTVDTTTYAPSNKAYLTDDTAETTIDNADYFPFYDTSATAKKKTLWSNIKSVLKTYFDGLYAGKSVVSKTADGLAPQLPNETTTTKFLRQDGSWEVPSYPTVPTAYTSTPAMDGVGSAGSSTNWAKGDHVHPSDTSKADLIDLASAFNSANAYSIGDYVTYTDGNMYRFTSAHTAGDPWSLSEVTQVTVGSELTSASTVDIKPPVSPTPTESTVVTALTTGTSSASTEAASAYAVQQWSNSDTKRFTLNIAANPSGITGVGTWEDTTLEADWWQNNAFMLPDSANSKNIDISFKFDPQVNNGETIVLGGYILDTTTGKLCLKFANTVYNAQLIAVDITYTRNNYS